MKWQMQLNDKNKFTIYTSFEQLEELFMAYHQQKDYDTLLRGNKVVTATIAKQLIRMAIAGEISDFECVLLFRYIEKKSDSTLNTDRYIGKKNRLYMDKLSQKYDIKIN